jgi:hypothetical protein
MKKLLFQIHTTFILVLTGCQSPFNNDLIEVYFGIITNPSNLSINTVFHYENEDELSFNLADEVYFRLDFLFIPRDQKLSEVEAIKLRFPNVDSFFIAPEFNSSYNSEIISSDYVYYLPLIKNDYVSYIFSIEIVRPVTINIELISSIAMSHVNKNVINQTTFSSEKIEYKIIKTNKNLTFNRLSFF